MTVVVFFAKGPQKPLIPNTNTAITISYLYKLMHVFSCKRDQKHVYREFGMPALPQTGTHR